MRNTDSTLAWDACLQLPLLSGTTRRVELLSELCSQTFTIRKPFEPFPSLLVSFPPQQHNQIQQLPEALSSFIYAITFGCFFNTQRRMASWNTRDRAFHSSGLLRPPERCTTAWAHVWTFISDMPNTEACVSSDQSTRHTIQRVLTGGTQQRGAF